MSNVIDGPWKALREKRIDGAVNMALEFSQLPLVQVVKALQDVLKVDGKTNVDASRAMYEIIRLIKASDAWRESTMLTVAAMFTVAMSFMGTEMEKCEAQKP